VFHFPGAVCGPCHGCGLQVGFFIHCSHSDRILAEIKMKMGDKAPPSGEVALAVSRSENCIESQSHARFQDEQRLSPPWVEHDFAGKVSAKTTSTSISIAFVIIDWNGEGHTT
jgi:hypothetical protein